MQQQKLKTDLTDVSEADMLAELDDRKRKREQPPRPLPNPDFYDLKTFIVSSVNKAAETREWPENLNHYIYEAAMVAIYGKDYWLWHNRQNW